MIDIHSHVLPGVDDGARNFEEALAMLRLAAESGSTDIVATPHVSPDFPNDYEDLYRVFTQLSQSAEGMIRLHLGCDFHLTYDNLERFIDCPQRYTINRLRYLMVELPDYVSFGPVAEALRRIADEGVIPVITHPERNTSLRHNSKELESWIARGWVCQITGQSVLGQFGDGVQSAALRFLRDGLVHVVASDGHDLQNRPPILGPVHQYLSRRYGLALADQLCLVNPGIILRGEELPPAVKPASFWSRILRRGDD